MKIKPNPTTGKGLFFKRLSQQFLANGHEIVSNPSKPHDIYLEHNGFRWKTKAPKVLRVDGVYNDVRRPYKKLNKQIWQQCKKADAIVYQSLWSKTMHQKYIGAFNVPSWVIYNGARPQASSPVGDIVVASGRWRAHKRIKSIVKAALDTPDIVLHVFGHVSKKVKSSKVVYHEQVEPHVVMDTLKKASAFVHLCWQDSCPNSVVEALSCRVPVVCNNVGGTQEIVRACGGIVANVDKPYDMKPCDLYHPPKIDTSIVSKAISEAVRKFNNIDNSPVDIANIARQYEQFFERMLDR